MRMHAAFQLALLASDVPYASHGHACVAGWEKCFFMHAWGLPVQQLWTLGFLVALAAFGVVPSEQLHAEVTWTLETWPASRASASTSHSCALATVQRTGFISSAQQ